MARSVALQRSENGCGSPIATNFRTGHFHYKVSARQISRSFRKTFNATLETSMAWKKPTIVEVPVGLEINMYACAVRK